MEVMEPEHAAQEERLSEQHRSLRTPTPRGNSTARQLIWCAVALVPVIGVGAALHAGQKNDKAPALQAAKSDDALEVSDSGKGAIQLKVEPVRAESLGGELKTTGTVVVPPDRNVKVTPSLQGRVREVLVKVGDMVRAGQPLAYLDSVDAANAVNTLKQAENKLRLAQQTLDRQERLYSMGTPDVSAADAALRQAKEQQENARVSLAQQVSSADAALQAAKQRQRYSDTSLAQNEEQARIGGFTQKPLADAQTAVVAARTSLQQAQADFSQAQKELDRTQKLKDLGLASERDVVSAQNTFDKGKVGVDGARETLALAQESLDRERKAHSTGLYANQQLEQARSAKRQADLDVVAAEKALQLAKDGGQSAVRQADLAELAADKTLRLARAQVLKDLEQARTDQRNAQLDLTNARRVLQIHGATGQGDRAATVPILAPISGTVLERNVNPGQVVDTSTLTPWQMFSIANYDRVWVEADVYEKDLPAVKVGQPVQIRIAAVPGRNFAGRIAYIVPNVSANSHTFKVRSELQNPGSILKNGMFADVKISVQRGPQSVLVPVSAVQLDGDQDVVYVEESGKYRKRSVQLGPEKHNEYVVRDGLKPGERVVTHGAIFLAGKVSDS